MSTADYPPILVLACRGRATAVWQVETDPDMTRGDFSGAWLLDDSGVTGFAASAEWIPQRGDQEAMVGLLLAHPVVLADDVLGSDAAASDAASSAAVSSDAAAGDAAGGQNAEDSRRGAALIPAGLRVNIEATEAAVAEALDAAREDFAASNPGKKQPAWPAVTPIRPVSAPGPAGLEGEENADARAAVVAAMNAARGLRVWLREWSAWEKVRHRRLGPVDASSPSTLQAAPLRWGA